MALEFIYFVLIYVLYIYVSSLLLSSENICGTRIPIEYPIKKALCNISSLTKATN